MRHRQLLSYEELKEETRRALEESEFETQEELANHLGVARSSVAKALNVAGPKMERLQTEIVETLTDYELDREEEVRFRVRRKDKLPAEE